MLFAVFLFVVSFSVFIPSLKSEFVWDDVMYISAVHHTLDFSNFDLDRLTKVSGGKHYRPMLFASLALDSEIWGLSPFGFHLTNVILHSIFTVLVFWLIILVLGELSVKGKDKIAFLSSLLFAVFPAHVESVAFISARADMICGIFFLLALVFHALSFRKLAYFGLAAALFSFSLMSKEVAVAFPFVAIALDVVTRRIKDRRSILRYSVYLALLIFYFYIRGLSSELIPDFSTETRAAVTQEYGQVIANDDASDLEGPAAEAKELTIVFLSSYLFYIKKLIFPYRITPFIVAVSVGYSNAIASISALLILFVAGYLSILKREFVTFFCIAWILLTLLPSALVSIISISPNPLAERFLYIPSVGFCFIAAYLIVQIGRKSDAERVAWLFAFFLFLSYTFSAFAGQRIWKDDLTLWKIIAERNPANFIPHLNYGVALRRAGKNEEAIREYLIALDPKIKSDPRGRGRAAIDLGIAYLDNGDFLNAELWFRRSVDFYPKYQGEFYYNMGLLHYLKAEYAFGQKGFSDQDYAASVKYLTEFIARQPRDGKSHLLLAKVYLRLGMKEEAQQHAEDALRLGLVGPLMEQARQILEQ